jgi:hypothetical protein
MHFYLLLRGSIRIILIYFIVGPKTTPAESSFIAKLGKAAWVANAPKVAGGRSAGCFDAGRKHCVVPFLFC